MRQWTKVYQQCQEKRAVFSCFKAAVIKIQAVSLRLGGTEWL